MHCCSALYCFPLSPFNSDATLNTGAWDWELGILNSELWWRSIWNEHYILRRTVGVILSIVKRVPMCQGSQVSGVSPHLIVFANFKGERARVPIAFNRSMVMEVFSAQPRNHPTERQTMWPTELSGTTTENFNFFLSQNSSLLEKSQSCSSHVNSKWFIMVRDVHWSSAPLWILSW